MSENIQSISQGTYTIGQTSATNFVAGPGIKIDEPSAGTVRIGNDETVLWSGTGNAPTTAAMTLSEDPAHFAKIDVYIRAWDRNEVITKATDIGIGSNFFQCGMVWGQSTGVTNIVNLNYQYASNTVTYSAGTRHAITNTTVSNPGIDTSTVGIYKIVGINRKEV